MHPAEMTLVPIGRIHSAFRTTSEIPPEGGPGEVELFPPYADALEGLEGSSHLHLIAFLHRADRTVLKARPRKFDPQAPERGVFATRSPARPNPLSLTLVPLLGREGLVLRVGHLDLLDGTPLIDLKPFCPGWDSAFSARHVRRAHPCALAPAQLRALLERDLVGHLGAQASGPGARAALAATLLAVERLQVDPRDEALKVSTNRADEGADALVGLTGAGFANGRLGLTAEAGPRRFVFAAGARRLELLERPEFAGLLFAPERWSAEAFDVR